MTMNPSLRKLALTLHVASSVGWLGAAVAYLVVAIVAMSSGDGGRMRASYPTLELVGWSVIVPLSAASLLTGIIQSLGTPWGLFRHYWVVAKLVLTVAGTAVLLGHMPVVGRVAALAERAEVSAADFGTMPTQLVIHAAGGVAVLLATTALSVFKPWGQTPLGHRVQRAVLVAGAARKGTNSQ